jgi:hypothetical protein
VSTTESAADNGVNVAALLDARNALTDAPEAAEFTWRASNEWLRGSCDAVGGRRLSALAWQLEHGDDAGAAAAELEPVYRDTLEQLRRVEGQGGGLCRDVVAVDSDLELGGRVEGNVPAAARCRLDAEPSDARAVDLSAVLDLVPDDRCQRVEEHLRVLLVPGPSPCPPT